MEVRTFNQNHADNPHESVYTENHTKHDRAIPSMKTGLTNGTESHFVRPDRQYRFGRRQPDVRDSLLTGGVA